MISDGKGRELLIEFSAMPIGQNKGHKSLSAHGVDTPTLPHPKTCLLSLHIVMRMCTEDVGQQRRFRM
jgi:hypothetical protein